MTGRLAGKHALVTAAGAGIGRATALAFAEAGATVLATDIHEESLASLASSHSAIRTQSLDVTDAAAIQALAASVGRVAVTKRTRTSPDKNVRWVGLGINTARPPR